MALSDEDRKLIAAVLRWGRANSWYPAWKGWQVGDQFDPTARIYWWAQTDGQAMSLNRKGMRDLDAPVGSVIETVDILVAVGVLPSEFSSAYRQHADDMWRDAHDCCLLSSKDRAASCPKDLFKLGQCDGAVKLAGMGLQLARVGEDGFHDTLAWVRSIEVTP